MKSRILIAADLHFCTIPNRGNLTNLFRERPLDLIERAIHGAVEPGQLTLRCPASYSPAIAEAMARFVHQNKNKLDALFIVGDLATTGRSDDLEVAKEFISGPGQGYAAGRCKSTLNGSALRTILMPGNHDRFLDDDCAAGSTQFEKHFALQWGPAGTKVRTDYYLADGSDIAVISVDYCLDKNSDETMTFGHLSQGMAYDDITEEACKQTEAARAASTSRVVIWCIHFPPISGLGRHGLIKFEAVRAAAKEVDVNFILSGHTHEKDMHVSDGIINFIAGSATCPERSLGNWMHIVEFETELRFVRNIKCVDLAWNYRQGSFVATALRKINYDSP